MVKVDKYVRQLLFEHDCVIIPDFGGLLTHKVGVHYDQARGSFIPVSKRLAFNEILRIDDGLLSYWISKQENIARYQATQLVSQYVEGLRTSLDAENSLTIDRIGNFSSNKEGKLVFEPDYTQNFDAEWYGFESVSARLLSEELPVAEVESDPGKISRVTRPLVAAEPNLTRKWSNFGWVAAAALAGLVFLLSMIYRPIDHTMLSTLNPVASLENLFIRTPDDDNQPVKPFAYVEPTPVPVSIWQDVASKKTVAVDSSFSDASKLHNVEMSIPLEKPEVEVTRHYHLIAGSFLTTKHANSLVRKLAKMGFPNSRVINQKSGKWIMVAAESYESENGAYNHRNELDHAIGVESWVLNQ